MKNTQPTTDLPNTMPAPSVGSGDLLATPRTDAHLAEMVRLTSSYAAHPDFARELERENNRYVETLHDGFAVYSALTDDAKRYTSPECVSAVLDAFKRAMANDPHHPRQPGADNKKDL